MTNAINSNQFAQAATQGMQDLNMGVSNVISGVVDQTQSGNIIAGQAVKLVATSAGIPKVVAVTGNNDPVLGFALYNVKNSIYSKATSNGALEIALAGTVMYMTSNAAISAQQAVQLSNSDITVGPLSGTGQRVGYAIDAATASGQLIRVQIDTPAAAGAGTKEVTVTATLAQINAGLVAIPGIAGKQITVLSFIERVVGAFTTNTSVNLQSDTTSVIVEATAQAQLTNGAVLLPASSGVTLGAGFGAALPAGEGLKIANIGTAAAGGTSITFTITYNQF